MQEGMHSALPSGTWRRCGMPRCLPACAHSDRCYALCLSPWIAKNVPSRSNTVVHGVNFTHAGIRSLLPVLTAMASVPSCEERPEYLIETVHLRDEASPRFHVILNGCAHEAGFIWLAFAQSP